MSPTVAKALEQNPGLLDEMVLAFQLEKKRAEAGNFKEPADANIVPNPNLRANHEYPRMVYHHGTKQTAIVNNKAEHDAALEAGHQNRPWIEKPIDEGLPTAEELQAASQERIAALEAKLEVLTKALEGKAKK